MKTSLTIFGGSMLLLSLAGVVMPSAAHAADSLGVVCGHEGSTEGYDIYHNLNYGLWWFADKDNVSYCKQGKDNFSDQKQNTLIFVHGWAPTSTMQQTRFNFNARDLSGPSYATDLVAQWLNGSDNKGAWNVGVFYWNQFADEIPTSIKDDGSWDMLSPVQNVEAKIWHNNPSWVDDFNISHTTDLPSVGQLFHDQYIQQLADYKGDNIRLVAESLGTQLVIDAAKMIDDDVQAKKIPANLLPKQIVLLDPVMTEQGTDSQGKLLSQTMLDDIAQLENDGVIISGYRTSTLGNTPDSGMANNTELLKHTAFSDMDPCVYTKDDLKSRHTAGIWWYFLSYNLDKVPVVNDPGTAPFAKASETTLKGFMGLSAPAFVSTSELRSGASADECGTPDDDSWKLWEMKTVDKNPLAK